MLLNVIVLFRKILMRKIVSEKNLPSICQQLVAIEPKFQIILDEHGTPPLWYRPPRFETLIHIILEQQVSLASALSAYQMLKNRLGEITPEKILALSDFELRKCYFSRQKAGYARNLADAILKKELKLEQLHTLSDAEVRDELMKIKGIGIWTSDIYLLMAMLRPDVMPKGDLALHIAYRNMNGLNKRPNSEEFIELTEVWKPFRSTAARLLWYYYLEEKKALKD